MFVWWAVFFFAGTFFPSGSAGASAAVTASSILAIVYSGKYPLLWQRVFLTCVSGLTVFMAASLLPSGMAIRSMRRPEEFPAPIRAVRNRIISITGTRALDEETRGLLRTLLIADRKAIPAEARQYWRATGTAHYLALSGLHLGLIAVPLFGILTLAGLRGVVRDVVALFALSFYAAVAGTPGSLLRALSMMTVMRMFRLGGIRIDLARCVITGAFLVCVIDHRSLCDTGFLLSFNAAAGVALIGMPVSRCIQAWMTKKRWSRVLSVPLLSLAMSLSVQLSMLSLAVRVFGFVPLAGPVMSVVMAIPVTALLYGGFIYIIAGYTLGDAAALPLNLLAGAAALLVERGAEAAGAGVLISDFDARVYIPGLALLALGLRWSGKRRWFVTAGLLLAAVSFRPGIQGQDSTFESLAEYPRHGARLYGGTGGILVLEEWPSKRSAPYLIRDLRRSGVRGTGSILILGPGDWENSGISLLVRHLGAERVFFSPWSRAPSSGPALWRAIREPTVIEEGRSRISVRPPSVMPESGMSAGKKEASLVISPLD